MSHVHGTFAGRVCDVEHARLSARGPPGARQAQRNICELRFTKCKVPVPRACHTWANGRAHPDSPTLTPLPQHMNPTLRSPSRGRASPGPERSKLCTLHMCLRAQFQISASHAVGKPTARRKASGPLYNKLFGVISDGFASFLPCFASDPSLATEFRRDFTLFGRARGPVFSALASILLLASIVSALT